MTFTKLTMKTTRFALTALAAAAIFTVAASAQLTLDSFPTGNNGKNYVKTITTTATVTHYEALPSGSPLGPARTTVFSVGLNPYSQTSTLDVGNNILIVDAAFQSDSCLNLVYGVTTKGVAAPLDLNLGAYTGLQLNFAGSSGQENMNVLIEVDPSSGGAYTSETQVSTSYPPYTVTFPFTSFTETGGGTLTQADLSDISYITIEFGCSYTQSFGVTSFQAYN